MAKLTAFATLLAVATHTVAAKQVSISNALPRYNVSGEIMDAVRSDLRSVFCRLTKKPRPHGDRTSCVLSVLALSGNALLLVYIVSSRAPGRTENGLGWLLVRI